MACGHAHYVRVMNRSSIDGCVDESIELGEVISGRVMACDLRAEKSRDA